MLLCTLSRLLKVWTQKSNESEKGKQEDVTDNTVLAEV